ncbi:MAG: two pore domain potassium channel family protein [Bacteroidetes bacterium]|nr:two pore domain potassium channel family protein [Bacteroidota bacterium]
MSKHLNKTQNVSFYKLLIGKTAWLVLSIIGVASLYVFLMSFIDHQSFPFPYIVLLLAITKTFFIAFITIKQLSTLVKLCHSFERLFWIFGLIISICVFSFATDYNCLFQFDQSSFEGIIGESKTYIHNLYQFLYFSIITFSSVGYGDIAPLSGVARSVVMLEIFLSYLIIVFALANIKNMHINE